MAQKFFMRGLSKSVLLLVKCVFNHASFIVLLPELLGTKSTKFWFQKIWNLEPCLSSCSSAQFHSDLNENLKKDPKLFKNMLALPTTWIYKNFVKGSYRIT